MKEKILCAAAVVFVLAVFGFMLWSMDYGTLLCAIFGWTGGVC